MILGDHRPETKLLEHQIRLNLLFSRVAEEIYSVRKPTQGPFQRLNEDVDRVYKYIMSQTERPPASTRDSYIILTERLFCYKLMYILHQPYLRSKQWPKESRQKALNACQSYVKDFLAGEDNPSFTPYSWLLHHYNVYHPCAIILQDLIQYPYSLESTALLPLMNSTMYRLSQNQNSFWPCPPCKKLWMLHLKACEANQWAAATKSVDPQIFEAVVTDWDPVFASFVWNDLSPDFTTA